MKLLISFLVILTSSVAFASGDGVSSLIAPATNVTILIAALIYFLKTPAKKLFANKSSSVAELLDRASTKAKEAEMMMEVQKKKTAGLDAEISNMKKENEDTITGFEKNYKAEVQERIENLKTDAGQKIEAEKKELLNELNSNLLDLVISKAKNQIKSNKNLSDNATKNIVEGL